MREMTADTHRDRQRVAGWICSKAAIGVDRLAGVRQGCRECAASVGCRCGEETCRRPSVPRHQLWDARSAGSFRLTVLEHRITDGVARRSLICRFVDVEPDGSPAWRCARSARQLGFGRSVSAAPAEEFGQRIDFGQPFERRCPALAACASRSRRCQHRLRHADESLDESPDFAGAEFVEHPHS